MLVASFTTAWALLSCPKPARSTPVLDVNLDRRDSVSTPLALYTDESCTIPSTSNPNVTLGLNVCAVTTGLESFVIYPPSCTSGSVKPWVFTDVACGTVSSNYYRGANLNDYCYATYHGAMAAVMVTCDGEDATSPSAPTSTTTISVGAVANAATSTGGSTGGSTATATAASSSSGSGTSTGTGSNATQTSSSKKSGWDSLDSGARIGIIVALAVGIPPILIGLWTLAIMNRR